MDILKSTVFNSPLHPINLMGLYQGAEQNTFYIKRDDLQPFAFGGNKVRLAQKYIEDMRSRGCDCMLIKGNKHSNLCRVVSNLCHVLGYPCYVISITDEDNGVSSTYNSMMVNAFGAVTLPCLKKDLPEFLEETLEKLRSKGYSPYYLYDSSAVPAAVSAYVETYREIDAFESARGLTFDYIFLASGTCSTHAGLVCGKILSPAKRDTQVIGISIARAQKRGYDVLRSYVEAYLQFRNNQSIFWNTADIESDLHFVDDYVAGGYALYNDDIMRTCAFMLANNGIELDTTYTGKAFWGMTQYIEANNIVDSNILFIHTGGLPLFFDEAKPILKQIKQ